VGSFGNYVGATMGTSTNEEGQSGAVYDNSWVTNSNYSKRAALVGPDGKFVHVDDFKAPDTDGVYKPNSSLLGDVPGLLSDQTTNQDVVKQLTGPKALNWETKTFTELRNESVALNPTQIDAQSTAWTSHGNDLKTESEDFKKRVRTAITGKWSGDSAEAAEAATQHVTETSIYDFNPTSTALASRLMDLDWIKRKRDTRAVAITPIGWANIERTFSCSLHDHTVHKRPELRVAG